MRETSERVLGGCGLIAAGLLCLSAAVADERTHAGKVSRNGDPLSTSYLPVLPESLSQHRNRDRKPLYVLGERVAPGSSRTLYWSASELFAGVDIMTPVLIVNGRRAGPTVCLTAAVHGDELNGIEIVRRVMHSLDPQTLNGAVVGVPIANIQGFRRTSRYLPDRRDLNRHFPGNAVGSSASRIANSFFEQIISNCDALIDLHTGSFHRANLPQLRADLTIPRVVEVTRGFGSTVVLHSLGQPGTLRRAATDAGIPAVTLEAGEPMRLQVDEVEHGVNGIVTLLTTLEMLEGEHDWGDPEPVYYASIWVRAERGGILLNQVDLGEYVDAGDLLGTITDPVTNAQSHIRAPTSGMVLGRALNQVVMPGFATFRIGVETSQIEPGTVVKKDSDGDNHHTQSDYDGEMHADDVLLSGDTMTDDEE